MAFLTNYFQQNPEKTSEDVDPSNENELHSQSDASNNNDVDQNNIIKLSDEEDDEKEDDLLNDIDEEFDTLEEELSFLREQNAKLKEKYKYHKSQHQLLKQNFAKTGVVTMKINGKLVNLKQPQHQMSLDELSAKVEARLPKFLQKDQIYIPSEVENEIGIIDIKSVDWGDVVQYDTMDTESAMSTFQQNDSNLQLEKSSSLGSPFIVLRESDIIDA